jgi:hypothetical protein
MDAVQLSVPISDSGFRCAARQIDRRITDDSWQAIQLP